MITVYSDGGSRGNPGKSAFAIVVTEDGEVVHEHAEFLGVHTNNYAEYRGLIAGISKVLEMGAEEAEFVMDSQLVIRQMTGQYKVKSPDMMALHDDARALSSMIPKVSFRNVRRSEELIPRADALLNAEMDRNRSRDKGPESLYCLFNRIWKKHRARGSLSFDLRRMESRCLVMPGNRSGMRSH